MKAAVYSKTPIISPEDVKSMFSIIEVITKINREFLGTLVNSVCYKKKIFSDIFFLHSEKKKNQETEMKNYTADSEIGTIMLNLTDKLKFYQK